LSLSEPESSPISLSPLLMLQVTLAIENILREFNRRSVCISLTQTVGISVNNTDILRDVYTYTVLI